MHTFVHRLIFCAKITDYENIIQVFDNSIKKNITRHITGLLLVYSDFVIHLIESSEDGGFQLCHEVFINNSGIMTDIKCLYIQNDANKRFFKKWYFQRMNDDALKNDELEKLEDSFENICSIYEVIILNLFKLYIELWNKWKLENYVSINR